MSKFALFARREAKPGNEQAVAQFLKAGLAMANQEVTTPIWFALRLAPGSFTIFDAFTDEAGRQAHLRGSIAQVWMAKAADLLARTLVIEPLEALGMKNQWTAG